jgi:cytidylate kinase
MLMDVAKCIGVSEEDIADFSEDVYTVKSLVDKILLREKPAVVSITKKGDEVISKTLDEEKCLSVIQTVINSLAGRGNTVIVGRGGQAILKHKVGVLHVRIIAPQNDRIEWIMKTKALTKEAAQKLIEDHDRASAEYLQRFYHVNWEDPVLYDVVLNTWKMDADTAAGIIASAASKKW